MRGSIRHASCMLSRFSCVQDLCDPMDYSFPGFSVMEFSRQEHWSGLPCPFPGDLPDAGIKPQSPALWADSLPSEPPRKPLECLCCAVLCLVTQSCLTLWDPMDRSLLGSSVHGIFQARILAWVAMPSSRGSSQPRDRTQVSLIAV